MPFYLTDVDIVAEVARFRSALIVPCRLCPAVSAAVREKQPFLEPYRGHLNTRCYEALIAHMKSRLEAKGLRADVFRSSVVSYAYCLWTARKREKLRRRACDYEAVVVVGCEGAYQSVCELLCSTGCQVVQGMATEGLLNAVPKLGWPFNVSLELSGVTAMHGRPTGRCA